MSGNPPAVPDAGPDEDPESGEGAAFSKSLERGLMILSAFSQGSSVLGVADLARAVSLNRSTAYRYASTLARLGYVEQDPDTRKYSLGPQVVDLGFAALSSMEMTRVAAGYLQSLADETGFSASMAILNGPDIVYVERRKSRRPTGLAVELDLHVGSRLPAYCTAMGKVLLAYRDRAALRALLERMNLSRRGPNTITAREQLMAALAKVREAGFAVNNEELAPGVRSLAAPVRDRTGAVVAAINIAVHLTAWSAPVSAVVGRFEARWSGRLERSPPALATAQTSNSPNAVSLFETACCRRARVPLHSTHLT
jgi:IclR family transcriptional regulator, pca regulon regulatory protein